MGEWICYTAEASVMLLALYIIYKWALGWRNEPGFNRAVLLGCYAAAAVIPLVTLPETSIRHAGGVEIGALQAGFAETGGATGGLTLARVLIWVYMAGAAGMILASAWAWIRLARFVAGGEKHRLAKGYTVVVIDRPGMAPFSWLRYIVVSREDYLGDNIGDIYTHEMAHISYNHLADLIVAQIFTITMWYNPAAWLMARELRSVHEFQADNAVLRSGADARRYQLMLVKKAVGPKLALLANSLNHSNLKKRITMMQKSKSSRRSRLLTLAMAPAIVGALAVTNLPAVASGLSTLSATGVGMPETHKVTKIS